MTGPVDHVSDGERVLAVANGHELLAAVSGTGCMSTAITGAFLAVKPEQPLEAAARRWWPSAWPARTRPSTRAGPGTFHAALYDALAGLDPDTLDDRARVTEL